MSKSTSGSIANIASKILSSNSAGKNPKSVAGSALSQSNTNKQSSKDTASKASQVMRDGRTSENSKSVAGSVLSQARIK